ncbi:MAG: hypothetical protein ACR2RA_13680 [Geminicoccaceae bacterium]
MHPDVDIVSGLELGLVSFAEPGRRLVEAPELVAKLVRGQIEKGGFVRRQGDVVVIIRADADDVVGLPVPGIEAGALDRPAAVLLGSLDRRRENPRMTAGRRQRSAGNGSNLATTFFFVRLLSLKEDGGGSRLINWFLFAFFWRDDTQPRTSDTTLDHAGPFESTGQAALSLGVELGERLVQVSFIAGSVEELS